MGRKRVPSQVVAGHSVVIDLREARSRLLIRKSQHQSLEVGLQLDMALDMGLDVSVPQQKGPVDSTPWKTEGAPWEAVQRGLQGVPGASACPMHGQPCK